MASTEDPSAALAKTPLLHEFSHDELETFASLVEFVDVAQGEAIVKQDEIGDCMFIVVSGRLQVVHNRDDHKIELSTLTPGNFFGELALVDEGLRSASVIALEPCRLVRLSKGVLAALAGVYPSAAFKLLIAIGRGLVQRLRAGNQRYIDSLLIQCEESGKCP